MRNKKLKNIFTEHPKELGETYFEHMRFAFAFGMKMIFGGLACLIHAIFPFLFKKTGSDNLIEALKHFVARVPVLEGKLKVVADMLHTKLMKEEGMKHGSSSSSRT